MQRERLLTFPLCLLYAVWVKWDSPWRMPDCFRRNELKEDIKLGGFFGVASKNDCVLELFYGVDYHSHLGTRRGGMAVYGKNGFNRAIHNIENSPFRTKFERDVEELEGNLGIGCISDYEPQPLLLQSHLGSFAITTVGKISNQDEILEKAYKDGRTHFLEMSGGQINATELIGSLI